MYLWSTITGLNLYFYKVLLYYKYYQLYYMSYIIYNIKNITNVYIIIQ